MPTLAAWVHNLDPFAIRISGDVGVRWYGLAYILGFAFAWWALTALARRGKILLKPEQVADAMLIIVLATLVGGRLGYVLVYDRSLITTFLPGPPWWGVLAINRGGMASHGGMVGLILSCWWIGRRTGAPMLHVMDLLALVCPVGLLLGRIANFINGELLGKIVAMPGQPSPWWSVKFPTELLEGHAPRLTPEQEAALVRLLNEAAPGLPPGQQERALISAIQHGATDLAARLEPLLAARHASQLYQGAMEGLVVGGALWLIWRTPRKPGVIAACFLALYGIGRIATEFIRLPDAHLAARSWGARPFGFSYGQWLSVVMVVGGTGLLIYAARRAGPKLGGWRARPETHPPPTS